MAERQYTQREWRLLSWWLATFHRDADIWLNPRIGPPIRANTNVLLDAQTSTVSRVFHRYADALIVEQGQLSIIEASIEPHAGIFSELIHYLRLLRLDPAWGKYANQQIALVALVYQDDPTVAEEAPFYGIQWVVYQPKLDELPLVRQRFAPVGGSSAAVPLPSSWPERLQSWGVKALGQAG